MFIAGASGFTRRPRTLLLKGFGVGFVSVNSCCFVDRSSLRDGISDPQNHTNSLEQPLNRDAVIQKRRLGTCARCNELRFLYYLRALPTNEK